jgi:hypothetical protein
LTEPRSRHQSLADDAVSTPTISVPDRGAHHLKIRPGGDKVTSTTTRTTGTALTSTAWAIAAQVPDPELRGVTIAELGALRDVTEDDQGRDREHESYPTLATMHTGGALLRKRKLKALESLHAPEGCAVSRLTSASCRRNVAI